MRVDVLHRRVADDVRVMYDALSTVFPVRMPKRYDQREMNLRSFVKKLNTVTEQYGVFNEIKEDKATDPGVVVTSGLWIPERDLPENGSAADIRVIWELHPLTKRFKMTPYHWNRRRFYFYQLIMHELIHRHQSDAEVRVYRTRSEDRETKELQEYMGACDEIESHAHDAAMELVTWWPELSFQQAMKASKTVKGPTPSTYVGYLETFAECPSHPAVKHFKRKVRAWYDTLRKNADFYNSLELVSIV